MLSRGKNLEATLNFWKRAFPPLRSNINEIADDDEIFYQREKLNPLTPKVKPLVIQDL